MAIFVESVWIWVVLGIVVFAVGYSLFVNNKKSSTLLLTVLASAIVLFGGLALERYIETDNEAIRRTLKEISAAIRSDSIEQVKTYTAPDAEKLRGLATAGMNMATLSTVNFSNVEIKVNDATVPVTAELRFTVTFRGRSKNNPLWGEGEFFNRYKFTAIFEKHGNCWLATDEVIFDPQFPLSYSNTSFVL
jgi:hypothetical protein